MEEEEREYVESEDEDFNPEAADAGEEDVSSSSDEDESPSTVKPSKAARKRKAVHKAEDKELTLLRRELIVSIIALEVCRQSRSGVDLLLIHR